MKKLAILVLFALACGATSAKADMTYNCTGWNFSFSFSGNPGSLGPDPGTCVLQTGANYSSISPLRGTFSVSNDPEENGEPVSFVFNTGAGTGNGGKIPRRFQYPNNEYSVNQANLNAALQSQFGGAGDDINQDLWIVK